MTTRGMLHGRTAMVTGASSGIGAAAARLFAAEGAAVTLVARRGDRLEEVADGIRAAGGVALAVTADVTVAEDVRRAVDTTVREFGGLDAAFNNAGWGTFGDRLHELDDSAYDAIMDVNVRGVWNCLRLQVPAMLSGGSGGAIVNMSSTAGLFATGAAAPYVAAKHAVIGLTRAAAAEYGPDSIRVNALVAGSTDTDLLAPVIDKTSVEAMTTRAIQPRLADPDEVAQAALWLCSERSSFVTGAAMPVDGGCSAV
ncbi:glucose 1-dehydrogenase [Streptomyces sp. NPDC006645]|uniref:SDR family NAD(P)-dependent oxidoreductase n=1 Tax=unclassified Streptomyces TaxID=2593676 RepID=UPI0033A2EB67